VAVIGAGSFGAWTAWHLLQEGRRVLLLDAYGPGNARASSGGESRIIRMGYGPRANYTRWSVRSMQLWRRWTASVDETLFQPAGALWIARGNDTFAIDTSAALEQCAVDFERLEEDALRRRFPQFAFQAGEWALFEPGAGALMARRAVQSLVRALISLGARYEMRQVRFEKGLVLTSMGEQVAAGQFVFACGPWLAKLFPDLLRGVILPTRQEVLFFGPPAGDSRFRLPEMPCWIDIASRFYGLPDLESRGAKIADDTRGQEIDPDTGSREPGAVSIAAARRYLASRLPALADAPLLETRVCQYENTATGDYLLDQHPEFPNVWLAGGGSGHGFKHGPAVGEYLAGRIAGATAAEQRFSLAAKKGYVAGEGRPSF
jgi:monomeric sarcosine oxidase